MKVIIFLIDFTLILILFTCLVNSTPVSYSKIVQYANWEFPFSNHNNNGTNMDWDKTALPRKLTAPSNSSYLTAGSGNVLDFDGENDYLSVTSDCVSDSEYSELFNSIENITLMAWIKLAKVSDQDQCILGFEAETGPSLFVSVHKKHFCIRSNSPWDYNLKGSTCIEKYTHDSSPLSLDDKWHHVALTYTKQFMKIYVDGIVVTSCTFDHESYEWVEQKIYSKRFLIGSFSDNPFRSNQKFNGQMDEIRVYGRSLDDEEIKLAMIYSSCMPKNNTEKMEERMLFSLSLCLLEQKMDYLDSNLKIKIGHSEINSAPKIKQVESPVCSPITSRSVILAEHFLRSPVTISFESCGCLDSDLFLINRVIIRDVIFIIEYKYKEDIILTNNQTIVMVNDGKGLRNLTIGLNNVEMENDSFLVLPTHYIYEQIQHGNVKGKLYLILEVINDATKETKEHYVMIIYQTIEKPLIGTAGYALSCDGIDDFMFSANFEMPLIKHKSSDGKEISGGGPITIEGWSYLQKGNGGDTALLTYGNGETNHKWIDEKNPHRKIGRFILRLPGFNNDIKLEVGSLSTVEKDIHPFYNSWVHFAVTHDQLSGNSSRIYINGYLFAEGFYQNVGLSNENSDIPIKGLTLCSWPFWSGVYHKGLIDEIRIWNSSRTPSQIHKYMNTRPNPTEEPDLVAYWDFDDEGPNARDLTKNGFDLIGGGCAICNKNFAGYAPEYNSDICLPSAQSTSSTTYIDRLVFGSHHCFGTTTRSVLKNAVPKKVYSGAKLGGGFHPQYVIYNVDKIINLNFSDQENGITSILIDEVPSIGIFTYQIGTEIHDIKNHSKIPGAVKSIKFTTLYKKDFQSIGPYYIKFRITNGYHISELGKIPLYISCVAGEYLGEENICKPCPLHSILTSNSFEKECTLCLANEYTATIGSTTCVSCESVNKLNTAMPSFCSHCEHTYSNGEEIPIGSKCTRSITFDNNEAAHLHIDTKMIEKLKIPVNNGTRLVIATYPVSGHLYLNNNVEIRESSLDLSFKTPHRVVRRFASQVIGVSKSPNFCSGYQTDEFNVCQNKSATATFPYSDPKAVLEETYDTKWTPGMVSEKINWIALKFNDSLFINGLEIFGTGLETIATIEAWNYEANEWDIILKPNKKSFYVDQYNNGVEMVKNEICPTYYQTDKINITIDSSLFMKSEKTFLHAVSITGAETLNELPEKVLENWNFYYKPEGLGVQSSSFSLYIRQCIGDPALSHHVVVTLQSTVPFEVYKMNKISRLVIIILTAIIILILIVVMGLLYSKRNNPRIIKASPLFLYIVLIGAMVSFAEMFTFVDDYKGILCCLSIVLETLGFVLAFGAIFLRAWRIRKLFRSNIADLVEGVKCSDRALLVNLALLLVVFCCYFSVWFVVEPIGVRVVESNTTMYQHCDMYNVWYYTLLGVQFVILIIGAIIAFQGRKAPADFNESKFIMLSVYIWLAIYLLPIIVDIFTLNNDMVMILYFIEKVFKFLPIIVFLIVFKLYKVHKSPVSQDTTKFRSSGHSIDNFIEEMEREKYQKFINEQINQNNKGVGEQSNMTFTIPQLQILHPQKERLTQKDLDYTLSNTSITDYDNDDDNYDNYDDDDGGGGRGTPCRVKKITEKKFNQKNKLDKTKSAIRNSKNNLNKIMKTENLVYCDDNEEDEDDNDDGNDNGDDDDGDGDNLSPSISMKSIDSVDCCIK